jgi:HNH endonuclease
MALAKDGFKICPKCKIKKPVCEFHKDKTRSDGLVQICKKCKRTYRISPAYREKEKQLEKTPGYKNRKKKYYRTNKGLFNKSKEHHIYRTREKTIKPTLSLLEWEYILSRQENKCAICNITFSRDVPPERDCIVPLSKGGSLTIGNTQALCDHCNSVKRDKIYCGFGNKWRADFIF